MNHSTALGAKTARPCDSCLIKRARWFCAADDAFLCQSCDAAVHSANQLAGRHQRLRLDSSSCTTNPSPPPAWHQGFTKKARTPRGHSNNKAPPSRPSTTHQLPLVPELGADDAFPEENDEQLFCRVPVFDEFGVFDDDDCRELDLEELLGGGEAEFAAGFLDEVELDGKRVKVEDEGVSFDAAALDVEMNWELDCTAMMEEMKEEEGVKTVEMENENERKRMLLRLNYEAVIAAWASQGSPWTDGIRPHFNLDEFMAACSEGGRKWAGREARVSRYREKRRTRLFSKKIRYEVRKLNAEKRPRLKGRFVKRAPHFLTLPPHH